MFPLPTSNHFIIDNLAMEGQPSPIIDAPSGNSKLEEAPAVVKTAPSRKRKRIAGKTTPPRTPVEPPGEKLTDEERALRIAEAEILFPKFMASVNSRLCGAKCSGPSNDDRSPLLYLPSKEYDKWNRYCQCSPSALTNPLQRSEIDKYFVRDCRKSGQQWAMCGGNPGELDTRCPGQSSYCPPADSENDESVPQIRLPLSRNQPKSGSRQLLAPASGFRPE